MKNNFLDNLGIGIANAVWAGGICAVVIFRHDASLWLLVVPIFFHWSFQGEEDND